ncbi:hypothetical protein Purlil1_13704 [Purpureocillium lilacinum]|uniref:Adiponectin receptor protein 1 n=1 Tax=Purpureocillium lilacinum TaxID=33203 RepID=A0ABR0BDD3_PURLI|nr:hypothetical protein Purlil1_13704 [Purpureocillium lilacinum]
MDTSKTNTRDAQAEAQSDCPTSAQVKLSDGMFDRRWQQPTLTLCKHNPHGPLACNCHEEFINKITEVYAVCQRLKSRLDILEAYGFFCHRKEDAEPEDVNLKCKCGTMSQHCLNYDVWGIRWFSASKGHQAVFSKTARLNGALAMSSRMNGRNFFYGSRQRVNIWTHLIGTIKFLYDFVGFLWLDPVPDLSGSSAADAVAVSSYYLSVIACFGLSSLFHIFSDHSLRLHRLTNELDHLGIVVVMWGTGVSGAHFALRCAPTIVRALHFSWLTLTAGCCGVFTLRPRFRQPEFRRERFCIYFSLGLSLYMPLLHGWRYVGALENLDEVAGLWSFLQLTGVNTLGGILYALRVPERWSPGRFDLVGHSHNCMHIMAIGGAIIRLQGLLNAYGRWAVEDVTTLLCRSAM